MALFKNPFARKQTTPIQQPNETKGLNPNQPNTRPISGLLTPAPINYKQDRAYETISAVYAVVTYLMRKFSDVPIRVYKVTDQEAYKSFKRLQPYQFKSASNYLKVNKLQRKALEAMDENSDLARLLQQPNPNMDGYLFQQLIFGFYLLKGESFIWGNRGDGLEGDINRPILEMFPMPPQIMSLMPDKDDVFGILGWVAQLPQLKTFPVEDIAFWRMPRFDFDSTTHQHLRGQSPLTAGRDDIEGINALDQAYKATYQNRGANGVLVAEDPQLSPEQVGKMVSTINERINGSANAGTIGGLAGAWEFFNLSVGARDLQLIEGKKYSITQVAQLYGAPPGIWDLSESANNNITQYRAQVYTDVIMPAMTCYLNILNSWLLPAFGLEGRAYIGADYSEVPDLQADFQRMVDGVKDAWEITPNEKRELRGYEVSTDPLMDTFWVPSSVKPIDDAALNIDDLTPDPNMPL